MGGGLLVGLSNKDAARFAFLLATPIIGAAALLKLPELAGSQGNGVRGPALVGALAPAVTAYLSVRFLMRFFETRTLIPFAIYCFVAGLATSIYFARELSQSPKTHERDGGDPEAPPPTTSMARRAAVEAREPARIDRTLDRRASGGARSTMKTTPTTP